MSGGFWCIIILIPQGKNWMVFYFRVLTSLIQIAVLWFCVKLSTEVRI